MSRNTTHETPAFEIEVELLDPRTDKVYGWRLLELARAGYSAALARRLAEDHLIDLHGACRLLKSGCSERTAYRILA